MNQKEEAIQLPLIVMYIKKLSISFHHEQTVLASVL